MKRPEAAASTLFIAENLPPEIGGVEAFNLAVLTRIAAAALAADRGAGTLLAPRRSREFLLASCPEIRAAFDLPDLAGDNSSLPAACARYVAEHRHGVVFLMRAARRFRATLSAARRAGVPSITYVHNLTPVFEQRCAAFRWRLRTRVHLCDRVCTNSRYMVRQLERVGHRPADVEVVPLGVDALHFAPGATTPAREVAKPGVRSSDRAPGPVLVTVGRLVGGKGHERVMRALPDLVASHPGLRWLVVGDGPLMGELRAASSRAGLDDTIEFLGAMSDPRPALARADLFVLLAERETFGLAVLEAAAMGLPSVVLAGCGPEELVVPEVTGSITDGDPLAVVTAIRSWLDQPTRRASAAEAARQLALRYDWSHTTQRLLAMLDEVRQAGPRR